VPTLGVWRIFWPVFAYIISMTYMLTKDADVIYARYATYPLFVGTVLKMVFCKPMVVSIHGGDIRHGRPFKWLINRCLRFADAVVCYDNVGHINELKRRGIEPTVIPNGIDTRLFKPHKSPSKINKIIYVGGIREIKGFNDIVALSSDGGFEGRGDIEFNIYGTGSIKGDEHTRFHEKVQHDKMPGIMEGGQLFILPSYAEGVPGAMLEAMSSGMYVIASDLDFTRTVIESKFLFKAGDIKKMAELVVKFCDSKREFFGDQNKKNREIAVKRYSINEVGVKWKELILGLSRRD